MPKKTESQQRWLRRQHNDPFVKQARKDGYRSRAAYKLKEIQDKYKLIHSGMTILDLGAAPGSWMQIAIQSGATVTGVDLLPIDPLEGATLIQGDFFEMTKDMTEKFDGIMSDLSPSTCGIPKVDHLKLIGMLEDIVALCPQLLKPQGFFICKVFKGGMQSDLLKQLRTHFKKVSHMKPKSSRKESPEEYLVAEAFKDQVP